MELHMPKKSAQPNVFETPRGETITLPGNVTKSDFLHLMELAAGMLENPSYQPQHRQSTALLLRGLMKST
jgi:hypothetical protein